MIGADRCRADELDRAVLQQCRVNPGNGARDQALAIR